jgi:polyferredoxin
VLAFFMLPIAFSLFAGRTFCAGVCPHGALQDLVLIKPLQVPAPLEHARHITLHLPGSGVLFAATGSAFIICQFDPFVPIFRMNGRTLMVPPVLACWCWGCLSAGRLQVPLPARSL